MTAESSLIELDRRFEVQRSSSLFVNSLEKGFAVLHAFAPGRQQLSLAAIARFSALDKSAAQRFVHTLHTLGYLRKDEETKLYSLSPRLLEFGYSYLYSDPLVQRVQPYLAQLHEQCGETVNLATLDGSDIIIVSRLPSRKVVSINVHIGSRIPAVYSASGIVMLARLPEPERQEILRRSRLHPYTPKSIVNRRELERMVATAGRDGFCISESQYFPGDVSIAAPIVDLSGRVVAALSISTVASATGLAAARKKLVSLTVEAAFAASLALGH